MKRRLFCILIVILLIAWICTSIAQGAAPHNIRIVVGLMDAALNPKYTFVMGEDIWVEFYIENNGGPVVLSEIFENTDFHNCLEFIRQDGKKIYPMQHPNVGVPEPPPPLNIFNGIRRCQAVNGRSYPQGVIGVGGPFIASNFYPLDRAGTWAVRVVLPIAIYPQLYNIHGTDYVCIDEGQPDVIRSQKRFFTILGDTDGDETPDCWDDCPNEAGPPDQNGCPYANEAHISMRIIDLQRTGLCGQLPNGQPRITCRVDLEGIPVKLFDREEGDFISAYGPRPQRHLLDDIYENPIGLTGAGLTDVHGTCVIGVPNPGRFLMIAKYEDQESGMTIYTAKYTNFRWDRSGCRWHSDRDDDDEDGVTPPQKIHKEFHIIKLIRRNGAVRFMGGYMTHVNGSQLDICQPEYTVWEGEQELYPFMFTSAEDWEVDVCMYVPEGYRIVGIMDESEELVSTSECVHAFVAGETKVFLFEVEDVGSPEPEVSFSLTTKHKGKVKKFQKDIEGVRKKNEENLEKGIHKKVKELKSKWEEHALKLLEKAEKKKTKKKYPRFNPIR